MDTKDIDLIAFGKRPPPWEREHTVYTVALIGLSWVFITVAGPMTSDDELAKQQHVTIDATYADRCDVRPVDQ